MDRARIEAARSDLEASDFFRSKKDVDFSSANGRAIAFNRMNWANRLTLSRLLLTILFVIALNTQWQYGRTTALLLFILAGLTDLIDGEIARRYESETKFGKLMDP